MAYIYMAYIYTEYYSVVLMCCSFVYPFPKEHPGSVEVLAIMNKAAVNMHM